jgi:hypothetical protein
MALTKKQFIFVFLILWLHVSLLDLFFINFKGPVFLWQANMQVNTLVTHLVIATLATTFISFIALLVRQHKDGKLVVSEKVWALCSLCLVVSIVFLLF